MGKILMLTLSKHEVTPARDLDSFREPSSPLQNNRREDPHVR